MRKLYIPVYNPFSIFPFNLASVLILLAVLIATPLSSQQTVLYQDAEKDFTNLVKEYDQGLYGRAARSADKFLSVYPDPELEQFHLEAELYRLRSWLRMDKPGTIQEVLHFAEYHQPEVVAQQAIMIVGEEAFDRHNYEDALKYLGMVNADVLSSEERSARSFKLGYSLFIRKDFTNAAAYFDETKDIRNKYFYPSNYYYGMTRYFSGKYDEAIRSFELVAPSEFYKDYIPYYITQIHFNNKEYQKVIGYGNQSINSPTVLNKTEIRQLIGQAYFETGDYVAAIPHLAYVNQHSDKLREDDFYQLGISYYKTGDFEKAIPVLLEIRNQTGVKAHYANYYLGQSYLKTGDKTSARNSLMNASKMEDVPAIKAEATFHYGRLSAEAGDDVEAIRVLQTIPSSSPVYNESQNTLAGILTNTGDYALAVRELEAMKSLSPTLKTAYQKVTLYRAEQLIQEGNDTEAQALLDKSLQYTYDKSIKARALFWKGENAHLNKEYAESQKWYNQYFSLVDETKNLPPQQSKPIAQYNQGYNQLRTGDFYNAQINFDNAVTGIESMNLTGSQNVLIKNQIYPDAVLRAGDAAFKRNQYDKANQYYDQSIRNKYAGADYAKFQKAIIKGLQKKPQEKIALLEEVADMPGSLWADDALYQAGSTYQEENQMPKAIASYERIVSQFKERSPLLHPALLRLGLLSYNSEQYEPSLKYYKSIFQYNPDPQTAREAMAAIQEIYVNQLDKPDAFFDFAGTIPGFSVSGAEKDSILYSAAENHYANAEYEKAVQSFQQYIDQNPTGASTLKAKYLKAESLSLLKRYSDALTAYEVVIKLGQSPYLATSLYKAALISYNQQQDMARAYTYYAQYLPLAETDEQQYDATLGALRSAFKLKKPDDVYKMAALINAHPKATDDIRALAHYYSATMALSTSTYDKAIEYYNAVIRINSADLAAESRFQIADIYEKRGESEIASKLAEEAARTNVGYPFWVAKSLILLSDIKLKEGDLLNARAILEAIIENFQGDETIMKEATEKLDKVKVAEENKNRIKPIGSDTLEMQNPHKD